MEFLVACHSFTQTDRNSKLANAAMDISVWQPNSGEITFSLYQCRIKIAK